MAKNATDAASGYTNQVRWLIGISGAAIAAVLVRYELVWQQPVWVRVAIAFGVALLLFSIYAAVNYLLWISAVRRYQEMLPVLETDLRSETIQSKKDLLQTKIKAVTGRQAKAAKEMPIWHRAYTYSFDLAALIAVVVLFAAIVIPRPTKSEDAKTSAIPTSQRFAIVQSAVHRTAHGRQAHTFLLDQQTGKIWQMVCDKQGNITAFQLVRWLDSNGDPEKTEDMKSAKN